MCSETGKGLEALQRLRVVLMVRGTQKVQLFPTVQKGSEPIFKMITFYRRAELRI